MRNTMLGVSVLAIAAGIGGASWAREVDVATPVLEELVVTAERREVAVQDTPLAITALSGAQLADRGVDSASELLTVAPGVHFYESVGQGYVTVRGIGGERNTSPSGDPSVAFHVDGIYQARNQGSLGAFFDVDRVEVLRGPQGTLYGRNATGGSINVVSNKPRYDLWEGSIEFAGGNYNSRELKGMVNIPLLGDRAAARLSAVWAEHDGFTENRASPGASDDLDDLNALYLRGQFSVQLTEDADLTFRATYGRRDSRGPAEEIMVPYPDPNLVAFYGARPNPTAPRVVYQNYPGVLDDESKSFSLTGNFDLDFATLTAIVATNRESNFLQTDVDRSDARFLENFLAYDNQADIVEFRLVSNGDGALQWIVGAFGIQENNVATSQFYAFTPGGALARQVDLRTAADMKSYALFGQATYSVSDALRLTVGLRSTKDQKKSDQRILIKQGLFTQVVDLPGDREWTATTGKLGVEYDLTEDNMVFASVSRGYKAGGFGAGQLLPYDPEYIWSYEAGSKNRFFENRLQINLSAFIYRHTDLQVGVYSVGVGGNPSLLIENAAESETRGGEIEWVWAATGNLTLDGAVSLLDARYEKYQSLDPSRPGLGVLDISGYRQPFSPEKTLALGLQYQASLGDLGDLTGRIDYFWSDEVVLRQFAVPPEDVQPAYDNINVNLRWTASSGQMFVEAFGQNLGDEDVRTASSFSSVSNAMTVIYAPPRTFGVRIGASF